MTITAAQIRGARGILNWSQADLEERCTISKTSIGAIEKGDTRARQSTLAKMQKVFEASGLEFLPNEGVRKKSGDVELFQGRQGYLDFFKRVYSELEKDASKPVLVSNVDERKFVKLHGDEAENHLSKMKDIGPIKFRILIQEGDTFFAANEYAQYKWLPKSQFSSVPFYVFGNKLAIMLFDGDPVIILMNYPAISDAYRVQFQSMWDNALSPANESTKV